MTPPRWLHRLFQLSAPASRPDLEGDFLEIYAETDPDENRWLVHLKWVLACIRLWPLHLIIPKEKRNTTHIPMFRTYLKIGSRNLMKSKAYALINVLGLSLGLTACLLITFYVRDEYSFDRHIPDHETVYRIAAHYDTGGDQPTATAAISYSIAEKLQGQLSEVQAMTRLRYNGGLIEIGEKRFEDDIMAQVDSAFFEVLPFTFVQGDGNALYDPSTVVLTASVAAKYFGDTNAVGQALRIREQEFTVGAIIEDIPHNTHLTADLFVPIHGTQAWLAPWETTNPTGYSLYTYIRSHQPLHQSSFDASINTLYAEGWGDDGGKPPLLFTQSLSSIHLGSDLNSEILVNGSRQIVWIFSATAIIILLLAAINYINLSMAASFQRSKEVGMKKVMGASRFSQVMQFQVESLLVTLTTALIALVLVGQILPFFNTITGKNLEWQEVVDLPILLALFGISTLLALGTGAFPASLLLRLSTIQSLKGKLLNQRSRGGSLRNSLVTIQFFIATTLIVSTLSVYHQVQYLKNKDLGISPENLLTLTLNSQQLVDQYPTLREQLMKIPGVTSVSASSNDVTQRVGGWRPYSLPGAEKATSCPTVVVSHDFFETLEAKVIAGRTFHRDYPADVMQAYVLNEAAVKFFELEDPVGHPLLGSAFTGSQWSKKDAQIIGVVNDFHFASLHEAVRPIVFSLTSEATRALSQVQVRIEPQYLAEATEAMATLWATLSPERDFVYTLMEEDLAEHYAAEDTFIQVLTAFTALSILIGCLGLFGITAFILKRRTQEVGIRKVLGASRPGLILLLSKEFLTLIIMANVLGWPLAYYLVRGWVQNFAYQAPFSGWVLAITTVGALLLAFITILYHTLRVTKANPVKAIRYE